MPNPNDYSGAFADLQSPTTSFMQGLQGGAAVQQLQTEQTQQQVALAQKQQMQADLAALSANPTPEAIAQASLKYPQLSEQFKRSLDMLTPAQQQAKIAAAVPIHAAALSGEHGIAAKQLREHADALQNSGNDQEAQQTRAMADLIEQHPETATVTTGMLLASAMGPDKYAAAFKDIGTEDRAAAAAPTELSTKQADLTLKNLGIIGQTMGSLQGKDVKPTQVATAFQSLAARGVISKDELPAYLADIPQDPKQLPEFLNRYKLAGMKPDDQMKFTTPDANTVANNRTQITTTGMNNNTQIAVQKAITERQDSKGDAEASLDPETLTTMAQQYLAGDKSVMQNLGRGAQGSANIVALRQEITKQAKAQGMSGPAIAAAMADYAGTVAGQRTAGNRIANIEMAANEAQSLIPLAQQASAEVARSGFLPFGKAQVMFDDQTNNPALRKFAAANNALVNVYSRAISPGGVATVSDKEHARHMLSTAMDHNSYMAVTEQMQREIQAARKAPQAVRTAFHDRVTGGEVAAPAIPSGWSVKEH